ncbi:DUF507 family protein [Myxococcota bacterium]|nr:DUF507 family protein [Myxococcota bacterium]
MKLMSGKVAALAHDLVSALIASGSIEVRPDELKEVEMDLESVFREYIRLDREITDRARDVIATQKRDHTELHKVKAQIARERNFAVGEGMLEYLTAQIIETLIHSRHVEEVFGADNDLVVQMTPVLRKHLAADEELDGEVRKRIRNLTEGTLAWDVQYRKVMEELRKSRRLDDA